MGLPPAEAALAGNYVIGYTGEGGNEYWKTPIFKRINSGEIVTFVKKILVKIQDLKKINQFPIKKYNQLKKIFSEEREIQNIKKFLKFL